jgi:hypothetical protein
MAGSTAQLHERWHQELGAQFKKSGVTCTFEGVSCLGRCDRAPAMLVSRHDPKNEKQSFHEAVFGIRTQSPELAWKHLRESLAKICAGAPLSLCKRTTEAEPFVADADADYQVVRNADWHIDLYERSELQPYAVVRNYLEQHSRAIFPSKIDDVVKDDSKVEHEHPMLYRLKTAWLLGMGGAGAPAYNKWKDVWVSPETEKYIVRWTPLFGQKTNDPSLHFRQSSVLANRLLLWASWRLVTLFTPGETEAGSAGEQPAKG